jgi:hypothetical protein
MGTPNAPRHDSGPIRARNDVACPFKKQSSGLGEFDTSLRSTQEHRLQLRFELPNLMAQRGLRDSQVRGRLTEVQRLRDGDEVPQVPQLHDRPRAISRQYLLMMAI